MNRFHRIAAYLLAATFTIGNSTVPAHAQLDNIDPGLSYLDNIGRIGAVGAGGGGIGLMAVPPAAEEETEESIWLFQGFSAGYLYSRRDSHDANDQETDLHTVVPEYFVFSKNRFSLDASMAYTRIDSDDNDGTDGDGNAFNATIVPAQELLTVFMKAPPELTMLHFGVLLGYQHVNNELHYPSATIRGNTDTFSVGPNMVLKHTIRTRAEPIRPLWDFYLVPAYVFQVGTGNFSGTDNFDISSGTVAIQARGDFWALPNLAVVTTAQWRRDIQQALGPLPESHENWAEFGSSLRWAINPDVGLRLGYRYAAFHSDYDSHTLDLRIELPPFPY